MIVRSRYWEMRRCPRQYHKLTRHSTFRVLRRQGEGKSLTVTEHAGVGVVQVRRSALIRSAKIPLLYIMYFLDFSF